MRLAAVVRYTVYWSQEGLFGIEAPIYQLLKLKFYCEGNYMNTLWMPSSFPTFQMHKEIGYIIFETHICRLIFPISKCTRIIMIIYLDSYSMKGCTWFVFSCTLLNYRRCHCSVKIMDITIITEWSVVVKYFCNETSITKTWFYQSPPDYPNFTFLISIK